MTVCVAALAAHSRALVCIADKAVSYDDYIQWDSDSSKMVRLNSDKCVLLFAGAEQDTSEVISRLLVVEDQVGTDKIRTKRVLEKEAKETIDFLVDRLYLSPRQIARSEYVSAISQGQVNDYMKSIAEEIHAFRINCSLLVCGSEKSKMFILELDSKGLVTDMSTTGFHAIGSGSQKAISRLLFSEHKREHDIERVLFDAFDAKVNAEMAVGVGYEWDAWVILPGKLGVHEVPNDVKDILERAWARYARSPFEKYNSKEDKKGPPRDWKDRLHKYSESIIKSKLGKEE